MEAQCVDHQPGPGGRRLSLKKVGQPISSCLHYPLPLGWLFVDQEKK
jgi:hypothetical protein